MNTATKVAGFAAALVVAAAAGAGTGALVGPVRSAAPASADTSHHGAHDEPSPTTSPQPAPPIEMPGGLMISADGYTLSLDSTTAAAGAQVPLSFRVLGPDDRPVTAYETTHDKDLHLIVVRRDLSGYQHVHPVLGDDGTWTAPIDLEPGPWRVFADFVPSGAAPLVLGADLAVAGDHSPRPLPEPATVAEVDGYRVELAGDLVPGRSSRLTLTVTRDGRPVTDLEPYLGAYGHLVTLRDGDLAYLHVHPAGEISDGTARPGPDIAFHATAPSAGTYRLFLDFQHDGVVRTAEFTARAGADAGATGTGPGSLPEPVPTDTGAGSDHGAHHDH